MALANSQIKRVILPSILVILCGGFFGYYFYNTLSSQSPSNYVLSVSDANWITIPNQPFGSDYTCFRKKLYLPIEVKNAWISILATGSYRLVVNGKHEVVPDFSYYLGKRDEFLRIPLLPLRAGVHDITSLLQSGYNSMAIEIIQFSYNEPARLSVEGEYSLISGGTQRFISDGSWKVSTLQNWQGKGNISWYHPLFDDLNWSDAAVIQRADEKFKLNYPMLVIKIPLLGQWMTETIGNSKNCYFRKSFILPKKDNLSSGWVRIASNGGYYLFINETLIGARDSFKETIDIYNISPHLREGDNVIAVNTFSDSQQVSLLADGMLIKENESRTLFVSDSSWRVSSDNKKGWLNSEYDDSGWKSSDISFEKPIFSSNLTREIKDSTSRNSYNLRKAFSITLVIVLFALGFYIANKTWSYYINRSSNLNPNQSLEATSILFLPSLIFLSFVFIIRYDYRISLDFPFKWTFIYIAVSLLLLLGIFFTKEVKIKNNKSSNLRNNKKQTNKTPKSKRRFDIYFCLFLIIFILGSYLRFQNLGEPPLWADEILSKIAAEQVLVSGYPGLPFAEGHVWPHLQKFFHRYIVAASFSIFGSTKFALRFPSALAGVLTILAIYFIGQRLFNKQTAFLSAAIYSILPWGIYWSRQGQYSATVQLLTLLFIYYFYKAAFKKEVNSRWLLISFILFLLCILTWKAAALLIPAAFLTLVIIKGKNLTWLRDPRIWLMAIGSVVVVTSIILIQAHYQQSEVRGVRIEAHMATTKPQLSFFNPWFDPWFYLRNFLFLRDHQILSILLIIGFTISLFSRDKHRALFYISLQFIFVTILNTGMTDNKSIRFMAFMLPLFIMIASATVFMLYNRISMMAKDAGNYFSLKMGKKIFILGMLALVILSSNPYIIKLYGLPHWNSRGTGYSVWFFEPPCLFVKKYSRPDDIIIAKDVNALYIKYLIGRCDYFFTSREMMDWRIIFQEEEEQYSFFSAGDIAFIKGESELKEILSKNNRVWLLTRGMLATAKSTKLIQENMVMVYSAYGFEIYLWEK